VKRYGAVQVDVDGWWAYCAAYGEAAPLDPDPVYREALPRLRALLDRHNVRATLFVVGADLTVPWKRRLIADMARDGHEIANHTFGHRLDLPGLPATEMEAEIEQAEALIGETIGQPPVGFRAPGYAAHERVYALLEHRRYHYDSSLLPTFWGGAIRAFQRVQGKRRAVSGAPARRPDGIREPAGRAAPFAPLPSRFAFGRPAFGFAPQAPYRPARQQIWRRAACAAEAGTVLQVPVTTVPLVRIPFHSTYVFSLGLELFRLGHASCRLAGVPVNYLFHAIDLLDDAAGAAILPRLGIRASLTQRRRLCETILGALTRLGEVIPTRDWVERLEHAVVSGTPSRTTGAAR
jgi:peptidoglycan/xylan/chitin deacetylase (PgdA/CDA1 family)